MRYRFFYFLFLSIIISNPALSQNKVQLPTSFKQPIVDELKPFYSPSEGQTEDLLKGEVISIGNVTSPGDKQQKLEVFIAGVHPRNCTRAMRKISLYETYPQHIDFIKQASYDEIAQKVNFIMDHTLLPFPMSLTFKIPRITKDGHYPFTFDHGFLKDLQGTIGVKSVGKFCLLSLKSDWKGPETRIPNIVFGAFLQTAGKVALEHLIRISLF